MCVVDIIAKRASQQHLKGSTQRIGAPFVFFCFPIPLSLHLSEDLNTLGSLLVDHRGIGFPPWFPTCIKHLVGEVGDGAMHPPLLQKQTGLQSVGHSLVRSRPRRRGLSRCLLSYFSWRSGRRVLLLACQELNHQQGNTKKERHALVKGSGWTMLCWAFGHLKCLILLEVDQKASKSHQD